jgi:hypothetical protein
VRIPTWPLLRPCIADNIEFRYWVHGTRSKRIVSQNGGKRRGLLARGLEGSDEVTGFQALGKQDHLFTR